MSEMKRIAQWAQRLNRSLEMMRAKKAASESRISSKVQALLRMAGEGKLDGTALLSDLSRLERLAEEKGATHATLKQVEEEVDRIYGDQSKNDIYYFNRRNKGASELEDEKDKADDTYGDQSKNDTFYTGKAAAAFMRNRDDLIQHIDLLLKRTDRWEHGGGDAHKYARHLAGRFELLGKEEYVTGIYYDVYFKRMAKQLNMSMRGSSEEMDYVLADVIDQLANLRNQVRRLKKASKELEEMKALTTYENEDVDAEWDGTMNQGFESVRNAGLSPIGKTIYQQLGNKAAVMLGGTLYDIRNGLGIKWPNRQRSKGNYVEIVLNGKDLYDMTFFNVSMKGKKMVKQYRDLFAESLAPTFEDQTGWYLRMSSVEAGVISPELLRQALEEDGFVIDPADQLDLNQPGPYDYNAPLPLDEAHPLGIHDWPSQEDPDRPIQHLQPVMSSKKGR